MPLRRAWGEEDIRTGWRRLESASSAREIEAVVAQGCGLPAAFDPAAARQMFDGRRADACAAALDASEARETARLLRTLAGIAGRLGVPPPGLQDLVDAARRSLRRAAEKRLRDAVNAGDIEQAVVLASYPTGQRDGPDGELSRELFDGMESEMVTDVLVASTARSLAGLLKTLDALISGFHERRLVVASAEALRTATWEALIHGTRQMLQNPASPSETLAAVSAVFRAAGNDPSAKEPFLPDPLPSPGVVELPVVFEFEEGSPELAPSPRDAKSAVRAVFDGLDTAAFSPTLTGKADERALSELMARFRAIRGQVADDLSTAAVLDQLEHRSFVQLRQAIESRRSGAMVIPEWAPGVSRVLRIEGPPKGVRYVNVRPTDESSTSQSWVLSWLKKLVGK
jgi:hypothetical protein